MAPARLLAFTADGKRLATVSGVSAWGPSTFRPLVFALTRESMGGIFGWLRGPASRLLSAWGLPILDGIAFPCMLAGT